MRALLVLALALLPVAGAVEAAGPGGTPALEIEAHPAEIEPDGLQGVRLRGTVVLRADHPDFGGFSGLHLDGPRMVAMTDRGWWLLADLIAGPGGLLAPVNAGFAPMRGEDGAPLEGAGVDAEGLTRYRGTFAVSFEQDHRIMLHEGKGRLGGTIRDRAFEALGSNQGLEALATHPEGWLIAIAEAPEDGVFPVFVVRHSGQVDRGALPAVGRHAVTGADVGPEGRLYVLRRHFSPLSGVSIRVERYGLGDDGFPLPETREDLAAFEGDSGIDNMEGISLWQDSTGRTRMTLISDDNFNFFQRTLLMDFEVLE